MNQKKVKVVLTVAVASGFPKKINCFPSHLPPFVIAKDYEKGSNEKVLAVTTIDCDGRERNYNFTAMVVN